MAPYRRLEWKPTFNPDYGATYVQTSAGRVEIRWPKRSNIGKTIPHNLFHNGKFVNSFSGLTQAMRRGVELLAPCSGSPNKPKRRRAN